MGYSYEEASSLIRFSASCETAFEEVDLFVSELYEFYSPSEPFKVGSLVHSESHGG
jgi:cysteine sulfinate desulfinase/cysteine desulfurase-like protein